MKYVELYKVFEDLQVHTEVAKFLYVSVVYVNLCVSLCSPHNYMLCIN